VHLWRQPEKVSKSRCVGSRLEVRRDVTWAEDKEKNEGRRRLRSRRTGTQRLSRGRKWPRDTTPVQQHPCVSDRERCMCPSAPLFFFFSPLLVLSRSAPSAISQSCVLGNRRIVNAPVRSTPRVSPVGLPLSLILLSHPLPRFEYPYQQRAQ